MDSYNGRIDLTKLGEIVRKHPELVKEYQFRNGETHKFLYVYVNSKRRIDQFGNAADIKVACKRGEEREGLNYFFGDLKLSTFETREKPQQQVMQSQPNLDATENAEDGTDLPF